MADADEDYGGAGGGADGANELVPGEEQHVDDSQLKIATFDKALLSGKVASGEEDEDEAFKSRGKLYVWAEKAWKERATGEVKLSRSRTTGRVRFLVRQEKMCVRALPPRRGRARAGDVDPRPPPLLPVFLARCPPCPPLTRPPARPRPPPLFPLPSPATASRSARTTSSRPRRS